MDAPAALTAERIDAMLSIMAEVCLETVVEAGRFQKAAEDVEAFERGGRALQRACRNLRQTIALKQRFDRDQAHKAVEARKLAEAGRDAAKAAGQAEVRRKRMDLSRRVEAALWDEYEDDDANERFDEAYARLAEYAAADDFLETPAEVLIQRLTDDLGLFEDEDEDEVAEPQSTAEISGVSAEAAQTPPPAAAEPPPPPPDPPPEPFPEPYVPPWERLRPGERLPGGSGW